MKITPARSSAITSVVDGDSSAIDSAIDSVVGRDSSVVDSAIDRDGTVIVLLCP